MNKPVFDQSLETLGGFVEVLTAEDDGRTIGYCLGGERPGPHVLVLGYASHVEPVFERLANLPTLPWMWGNIYVVMLNTLEERSLQSAKRVLPTTQIDETILLPYRSLESAKGVPSDTDYWAVLNVCTRLGMIAGRGVRSLL